MRAAVRLVGTSRGRRRRAGDAVAFLGPGAQIDGSAAFTAKRAKRIVGAVRYPQIARGTADRDVARAHRLQ